jgi:hypothetical protein
MLSFSLREIRAGAGTVVGSGGSVGGGVPKIEASKELRGMTA